MLFDKLVKQKIKIMVPITLAVLAFSGCAKAEVIVNPVKGLETLTVDVANSAFYYNFGDYLDQDYYKVDELIAQAQSELADYNRDRNADVALKSYGYSESDGYVDLTYSFSDVAKTAAFSGYKFFYGTVAEAMAAGYQMRECKLISVKDSTGKNGMEIIAEMPDRHVIITNLKGCISCDQKVLYMTAGCKFVELETPAYYTDTTGASDDMVILVLKK